MSKAGKGSSGEEEQGPHTLFCQPIYPVGSVIETTFCIPGTLAATLSLSHHHILSGIVGLLLYLLPHRDCAVTILLGGTVIFRLLEIVLLVPSINCFFNFVEIQLSADTTCPMSWPLCPVIPHWVTTS